MLHSVSQAKKHSTKTIVLVAFRNPLVHAQQCRLDTSVCDLHIATLRTLVFASSIDLCKEWLKSDIRRGTSCKVGRVRYIVRHNRKKQYNNINISQNEPTLCLSFNEVQVEGVQSKKALDIPFTKRFPTVLASSTLQPRSFSSEKSINAS